MDLTVEAIYNEFATGLRYFVLKRVPDAETADDIVQNVFLHIHRRVDTLRDESKLQSWIYQIARNAIVDYYRARRPAVELDEALALPAEDDEDDAAAELASGVRGLLACLPETYREALAMAEFESLPQQEIAARLGLSLSGAKSRVQRAREKLKEVLLNCCDFEFDRAGRVVAYEARCSADADGACAPAPNPACAHD